MEKLGDLIKARRESLGLSLREFGNLCGISHSYIRNLEEGDPRTGREIVPTLSCLKKLAPVLEMSLEELLKRIGYIHKTVGKFEPSNLKLIRGDKTYEQISKEISEKTGKKIEPSLYEALEDGSEKNPNPDLINILAKYANVDNSFFYRKNSPQLLKYAQKNIQNQYLQPKEELPLYVKEEIRDFIADPSCVEYLKFAKELMDKNIDIELARRRIFEK